MVSTAQFSHVWEQCRQEIDELAKHIRPTRMNGLVPVFAEGIRDILTRNGLTFEQYLGNVRSSTSSSVR